MKSSSQRVLVASIVVAVIISLVFWRGGNVFGGGKGGWTGTDTDTIIVEIIYQSHKVMIDSPVVVSTPQKIAPAEIGEINFSGGPVLNNWHLLRVKFARGGGSPTTQLLLGLGKNKLQLFSIGCKQDNPGVMLKNNKGAFRHTQGLFQIEDVTESSFKVLNLDKTMPLAVSIDPECE